MLSLVTPYPVFTCWAVCWCCAVCVCIGDKQDIVPEGEWEQFVEVLRKPLPITFRINGSGRYANELRENLESDFFANFSKGPIVVSPGAREGWVGRKPLQAAVMLVGAAAARSGPCHRQSCLL